MYNFTEARIHYTCIMNTKLFHSQKHCFKLERGQGPLSMNKVKQYEIVLSFKDGHEKKKKKKKSVSWDLSLLIKFNPQDCIFHL